VRGANGPGRLRALLAGRLPVVAPGTPNPLLARLAERAGFPAVYLGGSSLALVEHGLPDMGLLGLGEVAEAVGRLVAAVDLPVLVDADDGYGGPDQVRHTVARLHRAGAAAVQIEDQASPRRCSELPGRRLVPATEAAEKVAAAVAARGEEGPLIVARTDALGVAGPEEALARLRRYADAGADLVFAAGVDDADFVRRLAAEVGRPVVVALRPKAGADLTVARLAAAGAAVVALPNHLTLVTMAAVGEALRNLRDEGRPQALLERAAPFEDFLRLARLPGGDG
jgi:2-methylisocitrate lyase-like PEP mutase family enzyme